MGWGWKRKTEVSGTGLMLVSAFGPTLGINLPYALRLGAFLLGCAMLIGPVGITFIDYTRQPAHRKMRVLGAVVAGACLLGFFLLYFWPQSQVASNNPPAVSAGTGTGPEAHDDIKSGIPVRKFYSNKQKEEIVNGLQQLRAFSTKVEKDITDNNRGISVALYPMIQVKTPMNIDSPYYYLPNAKSIEDCKAAIGKASSYLNSVSSGDAGNNSFLSDPTFSNEAEYVFGRSEFNELLSQYIILLSNMNSTMLEVSEAFVRTGDATTTAYLMKPLGDQRVKLYQIPKLFEKWSGGVISHADRLERALP
jgi:hypothetical protein